MGWQLLLPCCTILKTKFAFSTWCHVQCNKRWCYFSVNRFNDFRWVRVSSGGFRKIIVAQKCTFRFSYDRQMLLQKKKCSLWSSIFFSTSCFKNASFSLFTGQEIRLFHQKNMSLPKASKWGSVERYCLLDRLVTEVVTLSDGSSLSLQNKLSSQVLVRKHCSRHWIWRLGIPISLAKNIFLHSPFTHRLHRRLRSACAGLSLKDKLIPRVQTFTYLGLLVDERVNWRPASRVSLDPMSSSSLYAVKVTGTSVGKLAGVPTHTVSLPYSASSALSGAITISRISPMEVSWSLSLKRLEALSRASFLCSQSSYTGWSTGHSSLLPGWRVRYATPRANATLFFCRSTPSAAAASTPLKAGGTNRNLLELDRWCL